MQFNLLIALIMIAPQPAGRALMSRYWGFDQMVEPEPTPFMFPFSW
jgi:hypothetical protein